MSKWVVTELGQILTLNYGWNLPASQRVNGSVSVYGSNGIIGRHDKAFVESPGIVVGRKGSAGSVHFTGKPFCPIDTTFYVTCEDTSLDLEFLYFLLRHLDLARILGDVGVPGLNREVAYKERVQFPANKAEQSKIAVVLTLVQRAMDQQDQLIALTVELRKTLLHKLFTKGLNHELQKETEVGPVPESWKVARLGELSEIQTGGTPRRNNPEYWQDGDIPWVKTTEINYRVIESTEEKITRRGLENSSAKVFPRGTLLVAMYGQGVTRGRVGILGIDASTNQACAAIRPTDESEMSSWFIYYFLQYHYEDLRQLGHGANQRNLNMALLRSFPIAYPTPDKQATIVSLFTCVDRKLQVCENRKKALSDLFRTLLHQLMTAQIHVDDLDLRELEEALKE